ncbi:MAG: hypothetical protein KAT20_01915, partial [Desulfuromonadales bacterium]|nr:hypothetical protein [Desulfuromonadales bacterium]
VLVMPMERVSVARMATAKPQGWVHAALGMGGARISAPVLNSSIIYDDAGYQRSMRHSSTNGPTGNLLIYP